MDTSEGDRPNTVTEGDGTAGEMDTSEGDGSNTTTGGDGTAEITADEKGKFDS
jgi:hypothetical protein